MKLVAVDMDGTFLRPDKTYDRQRFLALRQRMRDADIRFVVASGNQYWQLKSFFEPTDQVAYAAENGHFLYDVTDHEPFYSPRARPEIAHQLLTTLEERHIPYLASTPRGAFLPQWMHEDDVAWARRFYYRSDVVDDVLRYVDEVRKATVRLLNPGEFVAEFRELLYGQFDPVVCGPQSADLNVAGHNKAVGLKRLADRWGIELSQAIAFGDNYNDLEMLHSVGTAVAMENAPEDIRDAADRVAPPNTVDGVLEVLDELLPR